MTLYFDTTQRQELIVRLIQDNRVVAEQRDTQSLNHAQNLLPAIEKILTNQGKSLSDITEIAVNPGPGSFTGTRVGVAVANALSFALGVTVNNLSAGQARPIYDREPNISKPKDR